MVWIRHEVVVRASVKSTTRIEGVRGRKVDGSGSWLGLAWLKDI